MGARAAKFSGIDVPAAFVPDKSLEEKTMGKYFLAWILGVPAAVLVVIYLLMN